MSGAWLLIVCCAVGIFAGWAVRVGEKAAKAVCAVQTGSLYALIALMGMKIGMDETVLSYIGTLGLQALALAAASIVGSVAVTAVLERLILRGHSLKFGKSEVEQHGGSMWAFTGKILLSMAVGIASGRFLPFLRPLKGSLGLLVTIGLCVMLLAAGFDIGRNKETLQNLKNSGWGLLVVPLGVVVGSLGATMLLGPLIGMKAMRAGAVGAGFGWYTFSGVALASVDVRLGAVAFLTNILRELLAFLVIPIVAKRFGPFSAVAPAGATAMDTTLTVIVRSTYPANAIVAFTSGVVLSLLVPLVVGFYMLFC